MKYWRILVAAAVLPCAIGGASSVSADTLPPGYAPPTSWRTDEDPAGAMVMSDEMTGLFLMAGCDEEDGTSPHLALGLMNFVSGRDKQRILGFAREPAGGVVLNVTGTSKAGPFSFTTTGSGPGRGTYGGTSIFHYQPVSFAGGGITPAQLRQLMRATTIAVSARGVVHKFTALGSAKAIGSLTCTADSD